MKKSILILGSFLGLVLLNSCSSLKVYSDVDPTIDWSKYKTFEYYGWAEESDKILNNLDRDRFENAFGAEFMARGLEYVEKGGDMIVTLFIVVEQKKGATATTTSMGGGYGVGTLVCDVFDAKDEKLMWEGIGTKTVDDNPETRDKNIPKAVKAIMSKFPVQPIQ